MVLYIILLVPVALVAYCIGSMDTLVLASNFVFHSNLRKLGTGAKWISNFRRVYGIKGILLLTVSELVKDLLPILIGFLLLSIKKHGAVGAAVAAFCLVLGRLRPVFYSLKGSHATVAMIVAGFCMEPSLGAAAAAAVIGVFILSKRLSLATFVAALFMILVAILVVDDKIILLLAVATAAAVVLKHIPAMGRVMKGKEPKIELTEDLSYKFDEKF